MSSNYLQELGTKLSQARKKSGLSTRELANISNTNQSTISRIENGQRIKSTETIKKIITALPISTEETEHLISETLKAYATRTKERRIDAGFSLKPDAVRRLERSASSVAGFQSAVIPRLLRTGNYAKAARTRDLGVSGVLDDETRSFRFVVSEGALRTWPGDGSVMLAQLDYVAAVSERPNVWVGVVPWSARLDVVPPHGFTVYGDEAVSVETFTAEVTITDPDDVAAYRDAFASVEQAAVSGEEARELIATVRADFARLLGQSN